MGEATVVLMQASKSGQCTNDLDELNDEIVVIYTVSMYPEKPRVSTGLIAALGAFVLLIFLFVFRPGPSSGTSSTATLDQQASSTASQGLELARWIAKEYPPQRN